MDALDVPSGWTSVPMWSVATRKDRKGYANAELLSVYREYGVIRKSDRDDNHNVESEDLSNYKFVRKGDLVLNKMKTWQGSLGVSPFEGIVSPAYYVCELNKELHAPYIHYLLRSAPYIAMYGARSKGIRVGQWDLPYEEFREIPVLLPPIEEQRKIADFLSIKIGTADSIIEKNIELLALLEMEFNSHTSQVFRSIEDKCKFKYRFSAQSGTSISAQFIADNNLANTSGLPFIATKEVTNDGNINYDSDIKIPLSISHLFRIAKPNTVFLCSEGGSAGKKFAINKEVVAYGNKLFSIASKSSMSTRTLFHIFRTDLFQIQFARNMNGLIGGISSNSLGEIEIPDISGDAEMALLQNLETIYEDYLSKFDKISKIIELLKEYKIAIIANAVTGQNSFNREVGKI